MHQQSHLHCDKEGMTLQRWFTEWAIPGLGMFCEVSLLDNHPCSSGLQQALHPWARTSFGALLIWLHANRHSSGSACMPCAHMMQQASWHSGHALYSVLASWSLLHGRVAERHKSNYTMLACVPCIPPRLVEIT